MTDRLRGRRRALVVGLVAAGALALGGCVAPVVGGAAGGTVAVKATEQRGFAAAISDAEIHSKISELWFNTDGDLYSRINLTVDQGRVLLTGRAANAEQRLTAVRLAKAVSGVQEVINEIIIESQDTLTDNAQDGWIGTQLRAALVLDDAVHSSNYGIDVVNGVVYLMGTAQNQSELERVIGHAKALAHVQGVISHVRVL
jgi:osmotically-inducible protein OsmY